MQQIDECSKIIRAGGRDVSPETWPYIHIPTRRVLNIGNYRMIDTFEDTVEPLEMLVCARFANLILIFNCKRTRHCFVKSFVNPSMTT